MDTTFTIVALVATYAVLFAAEHARPLRRATAPLRPRLWVNVTVSATAFAVAALVVRPAALSGVALSQESGFGLMQIAGLRGPAEIVATFLLMDLTFYYWHMANHRIAWLWRMHDVHHVDPDLDVTTGFRFHFGEVALSAAFRLVQVLAIGPSLAAFAIYEAAFQTFTLFHHSNVRIPFRLERALNIAVVTPRMHGIHHSDYRDETNSNFGVVFAWWDHLHGTIHLGVPQREVTIGIPGYSQPQDNRVVHCLAMPFLRQRDYWAGAQGRRIRRESGERVNNRRLAA